MKKISILLPVYNEERVIGLFHTELKAQLKKVESGYQFQILYVVDKCGDNTWGILKEIQSRDATVDLLLLSKRFGHQMSLVAGMDFIENADAVIMMDSDLQHPPSVIPEMLKKFEQGFDVVQTQRIYPENTSFFKRFTSDLFYALINKISDVEIKEACADFRLISKKVHQVFKNEIREQNQFLRGLFSWAGFDQCIIEFKANERAAGETKYSVKRLFAFAITGIVSFSKLPLKIAISFGFFVSGMSFLYGIYLFVQFALGHQSPPGWNSLILLLLFFMGLQFIFIGTLGYYISSIFDEVKKRPLYIIDQKSIGKREPR